MARAWGQRALVLEHRRLGAHRTIAATIHDHAQGASLAAQMDQVEKALIETALRDHRGRVIAVAEALQLPRKTLYDTLNRHGPDPASYRLPD